MKDEELKNMWRNPQVKVSDEQINDSLKDVLYRIDLYEAMSAKKKTSQWPMRILKIAAILLLPILTFVLTQHTIDNKNQRTTIANIQTTRYIVSSGDRETITLSDGTQITLNLNAVLLAPDSFINNTREVHLEGEAYFKVAKDSERPFIVNTSYSRIRALGTEFAVIADTKEKYTRTTLTEGKVRVSIPDQSDIEPVILTPSEQSYFDPSMKDFSVKTVNTDVYTSWIDGKLIFENTPLPEVLNRLERHFSCTIICHNKQVLSNQHITAKFCHKETISDILNTLQKVSKFSYHREENIIHVNPSLKK